MKTNTGDNLSLVVGHYDQWSVMITGHLKLCLGYNDHQNLVSPPSLFVKGRYRTSPNGVYEERYKKKINKIGRNAEKRGCRKKGRMGNGQCLEGNIIKINLYKKIYCFFQNKGLFHLPRMFHKYIEKKTVWIKIAIFSSWNYQ